MSMAGSYYKGEPDEESRQQYATERIQQVQENSTSTVSFTELREMFTYFGELYDQGYRLRDEKDGKAAA